MAHDLFYKRCVTSVIHFTLDSVNTVPAYVLL